MGTGLAYVKHFRDLEVYKKQRLLARRVFGLSKSFPRDEQFSLTDQMRRSSRSVGAQIAEAWAKRLYPKHFISKLTDADGEQLETQHWLIEATDCGYLNPEQSAELQSLCVEIGRMLGSMIQKANSFTGQDHLLKEAEAEYLVASAPEY